jgi:hypothetical protein
MPNKIEPKSNPTIEKRSEPRTLADPYYSVEFTISKKGPVYQFKLRDFSPSGLCILVRDDSAVLEYLEVGKVIQMAYATPESPGKQIQLTTQIRHITKGKEAMYKEHFLVGLAIVERSGDPDLVRKRE